MSTSRKKPRSKRSADLPVLAESLLHELPDRIFVLNAQGAIQFANDDPGSDNGSPVADRDATSALGLDPDALRDRLARVLQTGLEERYELDRQGDAVQPHHYCVRMKPISSASGQLVLAWVSDVTDRTDVERTLRETVRELEESKRQALHAHKMESLGRLAGGIAHDFNNLLTAIISFSRFVMDDLAVGDPRRSDLAEVLKAADSASKLTSQLLALSRKRPTEPVRIELGSSVAKLGKVLERTLTESIALELKIPSRPVHVMVDPGQLDQLVMNLAVNARDAMPDGGRVMLQIEPRRIGSHPELPPGQYAALSVADTGLGMSEDVASHIFEPFFSTKGEKGTGLGLATCYGIVKQAGGAIQVQSAPHKGSIFTVLLPLTDEPAEAQVVEAPQSAAPARLRGLALVVEDQAAIRRTMARSLEGLGLSVLEALTAEDALAMVSDLDARIDLLVTDVVLPGLSGIKLADEPRARQPGLRILLCSGFVGHEQTAEALGGELTAFLPKPFSGSQVASKAASLFRSGSP